MIYKAELLLNRTFGYKEFRPLQKEVIQNVLSKRDTLVIMPTGGGKSLCYQIPAMLFKGLTVVVSPLISLMKDQVEQLTESGVKAVVLNSSLSYDEYQQNVDLIRNGKVKLCYVAPETLLMEKTLDLLAEIRIDCITIDEAHCISEWGHDFRPEYRQIANVRSRFKDAVIVALTATATPRVQNDIALNLKLTKSNLFLASFNRTNLYLQVVRKTDPFEQTLQFLSKHKNQSGIIYCFSRKQVDELYSELLHYKFSVLPYHAGLSDDQRKKNQELFIKDDVQIIVATIAFGMGINKPNVRFVIHHDLPKNIESYYQEIGRAGRDGLQGNCLLLFGYGDISKINYFIDQKEDEQERQIAKRHLNSLVDYAESFECRRIPLLNYFGENHTEKKCGMCDNCNQTKKDLTDITLEAQKFLSCVIRTGEMFGAVHIVDVLRGSKSQKVLDKGHDKLSTFEIGTEHSKDQWLNIAHQLIVKSLITKDLEYGSLKVTDAGREVLRGNENVFGKLEPDDIKISRKAVGEIPHDKKLFELLRAKRKEIADKMHLPPFVIFPDKTLIEMSAKYPTSPGELMGIHGIGAVKFDKYGKTFIEVIDQYLRSNPQLEKNSSALRKKSKIKKKSRHLIIGEKYNSGKTIKEILDELDIKQSTLVKHLHDYVLQGNKIDTVRLMRLTEITVSELKNIVSAFDEMGTDLLRPVYERLNEEVNYDDLHIARIYYINKLNEAKVY